MQKITVLCVGKLKEKFYLEAAAEYAKRLQRHCRLELLELPEQRLPDAPTQGDIDAALEREAAAIREKLPRGGALVAMCMMQGLTSAIVNPCDLRLMETIKSCDVFKNHTLYADSYLEI